MLLVKLNIMYIKPQLQNSSQLQTLSTYLITPNSMANSMALAKMDPNPNPTLSQAHPETMDFLSHAWCNFAVQALQPEAEARERSLVLHDTSIKIFESDAKSPSIVSWLELFSLFCYFKKKYMQVSCDRMCV